MIIVIMVMFTVTMMVVIMVVRDCNDNGDGHGGDTDGSYGDAMGCGDRDSDDGSVVVRLMVEVVMMLAMRMVMGS